MLSTSLLFLIIGTIVFKTTSWNQHKQQKSSKQTLEPEDFSKCEESF